VWSGSFYLWIATNHHLLDQHPHTQLNGHRVQDARGHRYADGDPIANGDHGCHRNQRC
jgi:hypothetical protein